MLRGDFKKSALKGAFPTEPFIDHNSESILVTCKSRVAIKLFRCHVGYGTSHFLLGERNSTMSNRSYSKIAQEDLIRSVQKHIFGFDIAMNELIRVGIVQGSGELPEV